MMKTAIVTGGNRGIGFEISRMLLEKGWRVFVCCRSDSLPSELASAAFPGKAELLRIELCDPSSIIAAATKLEKEAVTIDALINNAGILIHSDSSESVVDQVEQTLNANYFACNNMIASFLPLLKDGGRIVNTGSLFAVMDAIHNEEVRKQLENAVSVEEVDAFAMKYKESAAAGTIKADGWSTSVYAMSKIFLACASRALAKNPALTDRKITINLANPGHCQTGMSRMTGQRTAADGARGIVWVAVDESLEGATGNYYYDGELVDWLAIKETPKYIADYSPKCLVEGE